MADLTQKALSLLLSKTLEIDLFQDYGPNGLQIEGTERINKIAYSVSATLESIERAAEWGADALIVHHGLFWQHQGAKPLVGPHGNRVKKLIQSNINLYAYHLPLDGHQELGNAAQIAKLLKLKNIKPFGSYKGMPTGVSGQFETPSNANTLSQKLEKLFKHPITSAVTSDQQKIESIGIITGGANNEWSLAQEEGLDAYLTGEISEYNWHDAREAGIAYFAGGHHATERFGVLALMALVKQKHPNVGNLFLDSENPA